MENGHNRREFEELFGAFDSITASDDVKSATLEAIFSAAADDAGYEGKSGMQLEAPDEKPASIAGETKRVTAHAGGRLRLRSRMMRTVAAVACVAALGVGGIAYATPAEDMLVGTDEAPIVLHVNHFGMVLSADAETAEAQAILDEIQVAHRPYEKSIEQLIDAFERAYEEKGEQLPDDFARGEKMPRSEDGYRDAGDLRGNGDEQDDPLQQPGADAPLEALQSFQGGELALGHEAESSAS